MKSWMFLVIAITAEVVATTSLKASDGFSRLWPSVVVVVGYGLSFYFLALTLKTIPVGVAYAVWSGLGVVLVTAIAWLVYEQKIDLPGAIGMGLILTGVLTLNLFSKTGVH
ncbi:MAG: QacE family quaternary ammonium compound efflux SMR transporter [Oceanospirillaceae bacterium]|jgi:multidrug transporter EmrE-like cation transporter|uniref:DMT family transporter n=1 Tax=Marinobacterium litorale TaxID=404770 RepID=UPI00042882FF|nr:multidrug efflux SMR transporter [Marinobacterium litorale]MBS99554.1 QacE family quaternary ammonium compound efflux SMR transporter [Oceanospirillaceae bacterium]